MVSCAKGICILCWSCCGCIRLVSMSRSHGLTQSPSLCTGVACGVGVSAGARRRGIGRARTSSQVKSRSTSRLRSSAAERKPFLFVSYWWQQRCVAWRSVAERGGGVAGSGTGGRRDGRAPAGAGGMAAALRRGRSRHLVEDDDEVLWDVRHGRRPTLLSRRRHGTIPKCVPSARRVEWMDPKSVCDEV